MALIVVVDDDELVLMTVSDLLEEMGHIAHCCNTVNKAQALLDSGVEFDLLISDVIMPDMDGRDFVKQTLSDPRFANKPVILTSGQVDVHEIARVLDMGAVAFLGKPIRMLPFQEAVEKSLR